MEGIIYGVCCVVADPSHKGKPIEYKFQRERLEMIYGFSSHIITINKTIGGKDFLNAGDKND